MAAMDDLKAKIAAATAAEPTYIELRASDYVFNAKRFLEAFPNTVWHQGAFYTWNGRCWEETTAEHIDKLVQEFLAVASIITKDGVRPFRVDNNSTNNMIRAIKAQIEVAAQPPSWRNREAGITFGSAKAHLVVQNGMLDLTHRGLWWHIPELWTMTALPFDYDQGAECPHWEAFLAQVLKAEDIFVLQEWFGYCLTAGVEFQKMLALLGPPRSGKSTIADILCKLIGAGNYAPMSASRWNSMSFPLESTLDKRLIRVSDAREADGRPFSGSVVEDLLAISGGDSIPIRLPYRRGVVRHPHGAKVMWIGNGMPRFNDPTGVIASRFLPIWTTTSFLGREDVGLPERLAAELPGILNWALAGLDSLNQRKTFTQTTGAVELREQMRRAASPIIEFVEDNAELGDDYMEDKEQVYVHYKAWIDRSGHRYALAKNTFFMQLKDAYPQLDCRFRPRTDNPDRRRFVRGLQLREA
jgi:putative DNA primase/helicase